MSFNYMEEIGTPANLEGVNHLANLNYASCVRMESGYCGIRWSQYPNDVSACKYWTTSKFSS